MRFEQLLYLASLMLFYDSFPANKIGIGNTTKSLALLFILLFFIVNIDNILKIKWKRIEIITSIFFMSTIIISFFRVFNNNFYLVNANKYLNEVIIMSVIYSSFRLYFSNVNKNNLIRFFKFALYGYCINNIFGILQFIYLYISKLNFIFTINKLLLNSTTHLENERIQFLFGEPSFISQHIILIIIPILVYFRYNRVVINRFLKINLAIMFCMVPLSKSVRSVLDIILFIVIYMLIYEKIRVTRKKIISVIVILFLIILSFIIVNPVTSLSSNLLLTRVDNITNSKQNWDDIEKRDGSLWARLDYSLVGFYSIKDFPILGYGGNHYIEAYKSNLDKTDTLFYNNTELVRNFIEAKTLNCINMYSRIVCEFGIFGIIWFLVFLNRICCLTKNDKYKKLILIANLYNIIQMDSLVFIPLLLWCAYIIANQKINKIDYKIL